MIPSEVRAQAEAIVDRGVCPGCGTSLGLVAGQGDRHTLDGQVVSGWRVPFTFGLCSYTADELTAIVHIGTGLVRS